jgi:hypothetical protein
VNKFLFLSVIPLAATATVASVMMASAPAQAIVIGTVQITGDAIYVDNPAGQDDFLDLSGFGISFTSPVTAGVLTGLNGPLASIANINLGDVSVVPNTTYNAISTLANPFVAFSDANSTTFSLQNPFLVNLAFLSDGSIGAAIQPFTGTFSSSGGYSGPARAVFTAQEFAAGGGGSYSMTIQAVPEPLTILGTGLALGFGGLFKSKSSKKQSVKA